MGGKCIAKLDIPKCAVPWAYDQSLGSKRRFGGRGMVSFEELDLPTRRM